MINNSRSPVAEMLSGKYKIWLIVGLAILFVVDCIVCGVLIAHGISGYLFIPLVMTITDALYLAAVATSNQRFKYAKLLFCVYITLTVVFCVIWLVIAGSANSTEFTYTAVALWSAFHVVSVCAAVISYVYASKRIRGGRTIQLVLAIAFSCVAALGCGVYYGIELINDGYFGQGGGVRPLMYEYNADGTCSVVGVVSGNKTSVVVPYEFNGKKVVEVSSFVLTSGVKNVTLECDIDAVLFDDMDKVGNINHDVNIYIEKSKVDDLKEKLYKLYDGSHSEAFILGNRVRPAGLDKNEVYVTFDYDYASYLYARQQIIHTWYGKKGDVFKLDDATDLNYALKSDVHSDEDLYWSYNYCSERIMSALAYKDTKINGAAIGESCNNVPVRFQRIHRVYPGTSNDDKYDTMEHFDYSTVDGVKLEYRLTVADTANELLGALERGEGFVREMRYAKGANISWQTSGQPWTKFESLIEVFESYAYDTGFKDITIMPYWSLVQPKVEIVPYGNKTDVVYGDRLELNANVTHPFESNVGDFQIDYEWITRGSRHGREKTYTENKISYVGKVEYTLIATVSSPDLTSLTMGNAVNIYINSSKRPLTAEWTDPLSNVYDGTEKLVKLAFKNTVSGDSVFPLNATFTQTNASSYTYTAHIGGADSENYYIESGSEHTFEILPRPVTVDWGGDEFSYVYSGYVLCPTATAFDLNGEPLTISHIVDNNTTGLNSMVDVGDYVIKAVVTYDKNYVVDTENGNDRRTVHITPKQIDVVWGDADLTFNGNPQAPTASATGVKDSKVDVTVTGKQTHANLIGGEVVTPYSATASIKDGNYKLNPDTVTKTYTIKPFEVTVDWYDTTLTYNGQPQAPRPLAMGINAHLDVTVTGQGTDVGDNYTATVSIDSDDFVITSGESQKYSIVPFTLNVTWSNDQFTYDGQPHNPTVTATGINGVNVPISVTSERQINADTYTATAGISDYNYTIGEIYRTHKFKINKRNITVSWINTQLTYNGEPQAPTPRLLYAIGEPEFTVNGKGTNASKNYYYTAWIQLNDNNHQVSQGASCQYSINPLTVAVDWGNTNLAYNGQNQVPTASITGVDGEVIELNVWTPWQDVSVIGTYVAYAEFKTPNTNYELTGNSQKSYNIVKKKLNVTVRDVTTWKGVQPQYDYDVDGIVGNEDVAVFCGISGSWNTVGEYDIIVTMIGSDCGNYELNIVRHGKLTVKAQED